MNRRTFLAMPAALAAADASKLASDPQRPKFHFLPPANWMNDPNGPIFWKGRYHMFYQYNPNGAFWGTMHWGHAVSPDMLHWTHLPPALAPEPGSYDQDGVFSGCAVVNNGVPTVVYTGTQPETQCLATSTDNDLRTWKRHERNPVIARPPRDLETVGFRDPCVWQEDGVWYMALGSGVKGVGGAVLLYRSKDLVEWEYMHPALESDKIPNPEAKDPVARGEMWECPSIFPLGENRHVVFVSTAGQTPYWVGTCRNHKFTPHARGTLDTGAYYAPITQLDAKGRRILWGWIQERRSTEAQKAAGWSGVLSLPRELRLSKDGKLLITPADCVNTLRGRRLPNGPIKGDALDIVAEWEDAPAAEAWGLDVLGKPVVYERATGMLNGQKLALGPKEPLKLRVLVDCSVIEVFANDRACVTLRSYVPDPAAVPVAPVARGGTAKLASLAAWQMNAVSGDRLTR